MNSIKKIVVVFAVAILMLSFGLATASATSDLKNEKKNNGLAIESKEKRVSTYNIKWDANGGKIGTKKIFKTSVKKGSKINKLVSTPKRTGYSFKGWYSKKSGGSKITTNTKPKKSTTYWAQWTKKRVLNTEEKKLLGKWYWNLNSRQTYTFNADGSYSLVRNGSYDQSKYQGKYSLSNGKLSVMYDFYTSYDWGQSWKLSSSGKFTYKLTFYTEVDYQRFDQEYLSGPILVGQNARYYRYIS